MESVDKTLSSTQHLLEAIEQDDALLDDEYFLRKLEYLRMKHKETSELLARILNQEECLPPSISTCTCSGKNCSFPREWSFSGSVSAKLVTKNSKKNRSQSSTSATRRKQQEVARAAMEAYTSLERKIEEKRERLHQERQAEEKSSHEKFSNEKSQRQKTLNRKLEGEEPQLEEQTLKHSNKSAVVINFPREFELDVKNEDYNGSEQSCSGTSKEMGSKNGQSSSESLKELNSRNEQSSSKNSIEVDFKKKQNSSGISEEKNFKNKQSSSVILRKVDSKIEQSSSGSSTDGHFKNEQSSSRSSTEANFKNEQSSSRSSKKVDSKIEQSSSENLKEIDSKKKQSFSRITEKVDSERKQSFSRSSKEMHSKIEQGFNEDLEKVESKNKQSSSGSSKEVDFKIEQSSSRSSTEAHFKNEQSCSRSSNEVDLKIEESYSESPKEIESKKKRSSSRSSEEVDSKIEQSSYESSKEVDSKNKQSSSAISKKVDYKNKQSSSGSSKEDSQVSTIVLKSKVEKEAEAKEKRDADEQCYSRTKEIVAGKSKEQPWSRPPRSKSMTIIGVSRKLRPALTSTSKRDIVPLPIQNFVPQITIPRPFRASTRFGLEKPIPNTYSTKFVEDMVSKRKQEEELESQASKSKPFTAHGVPLSTYIPTNPRVLDKAYVEAIRKRLTVNLRKHFEEEAMLRKSKSMGDISSLARPVPLSTYVPPTQLPDYRRARSAGRRSVKLLVDAKEPTLNNVLNSAEKQINKNEMHQGNKEKKYPRLPVPDFQRLHAEMEEKLKNAPHKLITIPKPFKLSNPDEHKHRQCKSSSPPRHRPKSVNKTTKEVIVRSTHSSEIRKKAIRQRELKMYEEQHRSEKFWEERKEEMALSRIKLLSSMGSYGNIQEEIEKKAAEKRRHIKETTKDYEKYLAEMQQRVIDRPLIMEQQTIIAQKQRLSRKFEQIMAEAEMRAQSSHRSSKMVKQRNDSDISAETYSVKSKSEQMVGEEDYADVTFESEGEQPEAKGGSSRASSTSSSSSSSPSSSATSTSGSNPNSESPSPSYSSHSGSPPSKGRRNGYD